MTIRWINVLTQAMGPPTPASGEIRAPQDSGSTGKRLMVTWGSHEDFAGVLRLMSMPQEWTFPECRDRLCSFCSDDDQYGARVSDLSAGSPHFFSELKTIG